MNTKPTNYDKLYKLILSLQTVEDCEVFFSDLCTYKELDSMGQRIEAAELLLQGETYGQITQKIDISSATLSRVSRCVKYGQGYKKFLQGK
jgi:TrpR-related protein YerC/YecD